MEKENAISVVKPVMGDSVESALKVVQKETIQTKEEKQNWGRQINETNKVQSLVFQIGKCL